MDVRNRLDKEHGFVFLDSDHGLSLSADFLLRVALGRVPGATRVAALGYNPAINQAGVPADTWGGAGLYPLMPSALALQIASGSALDTAAGTGARSVLVVGTDINYVPMTELIALAGTSQVPLTKAFYRINAALVMSAGSLETNQAPISITRVTGGALQAVIATYVGATEQSYYTVAAGHTLLLFNVDVELNEGLGGQDRFADVRTLFRNSAGFYRMPRRLSVNDKNPANLTPRTFIALTEKTDFSLRCTYVSNDSTAVTAGWEGVLFDNSKFW